MALSVIPDPAPFPPPPVNWPDLDKRMSRAVGHLRCALDDLTAIAQQYGDQFGALTRPHEIEAWTRHAWSCATRLRDQAHVHMRQQARQTRRLTETPVWLLGADISDCVTGRLDRNPVQHPPPARGPHTGRMQILRDEESHS